MPKERRSAQIDLTFDEVAKATREHRLAEAITEKINEELAAEDLEVSYLDTNFTSAYAGIGDTPDTRFSVEFETKSLS